MAHKTLLNEPAKLHTYQVYWYRTGQRFRIKAHNKRAVLLAIKCRFSIPFVEKEVKITKV